MTEERKVSRAQVVWGAALVVGGLGLIALQALDVDVYSVGWPLFVIAPGLLFFVGAFSGPRGTGVSFMAVPGSIITIAGLLLAVQNATGDWQSWSYAWALVAPTGVGIGLLIAGTRERIAGVRRAAFWLIGVGLVLFTVAEWLMVRVFSVGGTGLGQIFGYVMPAVIVLLGLVIVVRGLRRTDAEG